MKKGFMIVLTISIFILMLTGCRHIHDPLHGIYYGYYNNGDPNTFFILAFSKDHPHQVALRKNLNTFKVDSVFKVRYGQNSLTVYTPKENIKLLISKKDKTLTCPSCDGVNGPKTYTYGENNGKAFSPKTGDIAYDAISKHAKAQGLYLPK